MILRDYQIDCKQGVRDSWASGAKNVCAVLPTGAGKTVVFTDFIREEPGPAIAIAHRQELVSQISVALGRHGVQHKIIAPLSTVKIIVGRHHQELGRSFYDPGARHTVAGVDTLIRRPDPMPEFSLWVTDECHHLLKGNKWGKATQLFPNARGLGVTATPERADGKGLGSHAQGLFDEMVTGPSMRQLINEGHLTDYRVFAPPSDIDLTNVNITASGDYSRDKLKQAVEKSRVVGDVVEHYLKIAKGKLGVTFATDVETATNIAAQFNRAGVPAEVISAKTKETTRSAILERFKRREILQLVNVDLFGEGFDLPAIEVVGMARPTASYGLYVQQFGRALRLLDGKKWAIIIDHVGNVIRHGLPDIGRQWTLNARERRGSGPQVGVTPVTSCVKCTGVYERLTKVCPFCGHVSEPASRDSIEFVDGDLMELDPATLARMRGDVADLDKDPEEYRAELAGRRVPLIGQMANVKRRVEHQSTQKILRNTVAWWAGFQRDKGLDDRASMRSFYFKFGVDVLSAQALGVGEAETLREKIIKDMCK